MVACQMGLADFGNAGDSGLAQAGQREEKSACSHYSLFYFCMFIIIY